MNLHSLTSVAGSRHRRSRVGRGRGSGNGKTCGRGHKGQMSRKGHKHKAGFEGGQMRLVRRVPKKGFHNPTRKEYIPVNVGSLSRFDEGTEINASVLIASGLARGVLALNRIKVLGRGELNKKLTVRVGAFSASARAKIENAGGVCEIVTDK